MSNISQPIPFKQYGLPEESAKVAAFLVSLKASYINDVMLNVDGGITKSLFKEF